MPNTALTNMQRSKAEIKKDKNEMSVSSGSEEKYPWGLEVELNDDSLKKLKIDVTKYKPDEDVQIFAQAKIESLSQSANVNRGERQSMTIQITHLQLKGGNSTGSPSQKSSGKNVENYLSDKGHFD